MRPWTVDADDIQIAEDFDDGVLHKPPWIDGFLEHRRRRQVHRRRHQGVR